MNLNKIFEAEAFNHLELVYNALKTKVEKEGPACLGNPFLFANLELAYKYYETRTGKTPYELRKKTRQRTSLSKTRR